MLQIVVAVGMGFLYVGEKDCEGRVARVGIALCGLVGLRDGTPAMAILLA